MLIFNKIRFGLRLINALASDYYGRSYLGLTIKIIFITFYYSFM